MQRSRPGPGQAKPAGGKREAVAAPLGFVARTGRRYVDFMLGRKTDYSRYVVWGSGGTIYGSILLQFLVHRHGGIFLYFAGDGPKSTANSLKLGLRRNQNFLWD